MSLKGSLYRHNDSIWSDICPKKKNPIKYKITLKSAIKLGRLFPKWQKNHNQLKYNFSY